MPLFVLLGFLETALLLLSIALLNISVRDHSLQHQYQWKFHRIIYSYFVFGALATLSPTHTIAIL